MKFVSIHDNDGDSLIDLEADVDQLLTQRYSVNGNTAELDSMSFAELEPIDETHSLKRAGSAKKHGYQTHGLSPLRGSLESLTTTSSSSGGNEMKPIIGLRDREADDLAKEERRAAIAKQHQEQLALQQPLSLVAMNFDVLQTILYHLSTSTARPQDYRPPENVRSMSNVRDPHSDGLVSVLNAMATCRHLHRMLYQSSRFWVGLAQTMYWHDLETVTPAPINGRVHAGKLHYADAVTRFQKLDSAQLDLKYPVRVTRRTQAAEAQLRRKVERVADAWYYLGLMPFWEYLSVFSLLGFFMFLPVYGDELIPGFQFFHLALFLIIPLAQWVWNLFISLPIIIWNKMKSDQFTERIPMGCLLGSAIPFFIHEAHNRDNNVEEAWISAGVLSIYFSSILTLVMFLLAGFHLIPFLVPFSFLVVIALIVAVFFFVLMTNNNAEKFDYFLLSFYMTNLIFWLIATGYAIDYRGELKFYMAFLPINLAQCMAIIFAALAYVLDEYFNINGWTDLGSVEFFCFFFLPLGSVMGYLELVMVLKLDIGINSYWCAYYTPVYIAIMAAIVLWGIIYYTSMEDTHVF